ncbi:hypothetical protein EPUS_03664 [Endocarpon pusillum Z07020]|uniref:Uncharacterized protein n=1 Tax=Endocarpon pusillum (strain Z07020 / HMAS-L-300199) TaxID=1263415 RepID=U1FXQ6_ENDPU|nr:uncharacterized protein EPUS_03664 [Endocarpon pusillum Z07020]ERF69672.1 hypothetical protein EPUS_03664 [Endocarpon pusillum Z07020]
MPDLNKFHWGRNHPKKKAAKVTEPISGDRHRSHRSPEAEELSSIAASIRCVIDLECLSEQGSSVSDQVSHLVNAHLVLKQEVGDLKKERVKPGTMNQEAQKPKAEWRDQAAQYSTHIREEHDLQVQPRREPEMQTCCANQIIDLKKRYEKEEQRVSEEHEVKVQGLQREIESLEMRAEEQRKAFIFEKIELEKIHKTKQDELRREEQRVGNEHKVKVQGLQRKIQSLEMCAEEQEKAFIFEKMKLEKIHRTKQDEQRREEQRVGNEHKVKVQSLQRKIQSLEMCAEEQEKAFIFEKMKLEKIHRTKQDEQRREERRVSKEHEVKVQSLQGKIQSLEMYAEEQEKAFIFEKMKLEEIYKTKQNELREQSKALESRLKQAHDQEQERLQKCIQSRNKALIARDNFSPITDGELKSMFSDLVGEVDALARLKWTLNESPWTNNLQGQLSDNPKRLQKQILQDTIWNALFENVFCSPFRVFRNEGTVLEFQWNKAFGADPKTDNDLYTWPQPSFDAERWRYETMSQGQEALRNLTSEYDPRTKLREGFQSSMMIIRERLGEAFMMVSKIDEKTEQDIKKIAEKAANMWVVFGTQRCRLLVAMKDLKTIEEVKEGPGKQDKSVELITRPGLRRIGDAEGKSWDKEQTVAGCEGEIRKILYSCQ